MKYIYYGGAFNPPTIAHIGLADHVRRSLGFDKVIFMPSKRSYITGIEGKSASFSDQERYEMLRKIAENHDWMVVSDYEISLQDQPRTYRTLQHLKEETGADELRLMIGSDWIDKMETAWKYVPEICREFGIIIMTRGSDNTAQMIQESSFLKPLAPYLTLVETPDTWRNVSSTRARDLIREIREKMDELELIVPEELDGMKHIL